MLNMLHHKYRCNIFRHMSAWRTMQKQKGVVSLGLFLGKTMATYGKMKPSELILLRREVTQRKSTGVSDCPETCNNFPTSL